MEETQNIPAGRRNVDNERKRWRNQHPQKWNKLDDLYPLADDDVKETQLI